MVRNTSTDVEKTGAVTEAKLATEKHLHGRGEDVGFFNIVNVVPETPPRTWRRLSVVPSKKRASIETPPRTWRRPDGAVLVIGSDGNTSTDVEKTMQESKLWDSN